MIIIFADKKTKCGTEISDILYRCIPKRQTDFDIVTEFVKTQIPKLSNYL